MKASILLLLFLSSFFANAQYWGYVNESEFVNEALDIEIDNLGNSYVTGYITGETAFSTSDVFTSVPGNGDIYLAKYNSAGGLIWVKKFGGNFSDRAYDLALDNSGNVFITGQFYGTVNFDGQTITSIANSKDIFLVKLNSSGITQWVISEGGSGSENAHGITCDLSGNVILTGQFEGNTIIGSSSFISQLNPTTNLPSYDLFVSKYDASGNIAWVKTGGGKYEDRGLAVSTDSQNNIYLSAQFSDTLNFAGITYNNGAYNVGLISKLAPNGNLIWKNILRAGFLIPYDLEVNQDELYITGDAQGTIIYSNNGSSIYTNSSFSKSIFVVKTNLSGQQTWIQTVGSENGISALSISVDGNRNSYVTGHFSCAIDQLHAANLALFNSVGHKDAYLWKINQNGSHEYLKTFGSKLDDIGHGVAMQGSLPVICGTNTEDLNIPMNNSSYVVNNNNDFNLLNAYPNEFPHCYLHGDISRNSFITNAIHANTPALNYFVNSPTDSLLLTISPNSDTVHFCVDSILTANPQTYPHFGPAYNYLWSTNSNVDTTFVSSTGDYFLQVERIDECSEGFDTTHVIIHSLPTLPLMNDNLGLAVNAQGFFYHHYHFCHPDSVQIWFSQLDPNYSIEINSNGTIFQDALPHWYLDDGYITVSDSFCSNSGFFVIQHDYATSYNFQPYIGLIDGNTYVDSIQVCENELVSYHFLDFTNNPNYTFSVLPDDTFHIIDWTISLNGNIISSPSDNYFDDIYDYQHAFYPPSSGDYIFSYHAIMGYDNLCGLDTTHYFVSDTFHVEILPVPSIYPITISGNNLLCPNGSTYLVVDSVIAGFTWNGPGIAWTSANGDSVLVTQQGFHQYGGTLLDTVTGCSSYYLTSHSLIEKSPPTIVSLPGDGIICPYDSVELQVDDIYISYEWTGPEGSNLSTTYNHIDDDQGFYYVTVLDSEGCYLTSPPFELKEFSTPYLTVEPSVILCENDEVTLQAVITGNGTYTWLNPNNAVTSSVVVDQAGWYMCELSQCGITIIDSVEIIDGTFALQLQVDTILCYQDTLVAQATPGYAEYEWSNGVYGSSSVQIVDPGTYSVIATNSFGCQATSNSVTVDFIQTSMPPTISPVSICSPQAVTFTNSSNVNWYSADSIFLASGSTFQVSAQNDTLFLVSYSPSECPTTYSEAVIHLIDSIVPFDIFGDISLCQHQDLELSTNAVNATISWQLNHLQVGTLDSLFLTSANFSHGDSVQLIVSNACFSDTIVELISIHTELPITLMDDTLIVCQGDSLQLNTLENYQNQTWISMGDSLQSLVLTVYPNSYPQIIFVVGIDSNNCSTAMDSVLIISNNGNATIISDVNFSCQGDTVTISSSYLGDSILFTTPFGVFDTTSISVELSNVTAGNYYVEVWDSFGCYSSDSLLLDPVNLPSISFPLDTILCLSDFIGSEYFNDSISLVWSGSVFGDSILVSGNGWYEVTLTNLQGCVFVDSIYIETVNCENDLPNVFTPNGDGVNDFFVIDEAVIYPNNHLVIMNRWGQVVFEEHNYRNTFDGLELHDGVYYYVFQYDYYNDKIEPKKGFFHIIR